MLRAGGFRRETLKPYKPYEPADPLVWGAWTGIIAALIVFFAALVGEHSPNTLLANPFKAGLAFYGFGALLGMFRNWFNERRPGL